MPFGPYTDFEACRSDQMSKGHDAESANAICGKMQAELEGGSNFVNYELDKNGHLILKYFFADTSQTELPTAHGHFSLDGAALMQADREAIHLPFSVLPSRELSVFGDWHPWHPDLGEASWEQHVEFARNYSPGEIIGITPQGASTEVTNNGGRFVFIDITDARAKQAYIGNPDLIPKKVSPGFLNYDAPNRDGIKNLRWTHLAAVPQGAYGEKARLYGSCLGAQDKCMNKLQGASAMVKFAVETQKKYNVYCPVGASEAIHNTSLINSGTSFHNNMSVNQTTTDSNNSNNSNTQQQTAPIQTQAQTPVTPTKQPVSVPEQKKVLRLKGAVQTPQDPNKPNAGQQQTGQQTQDPRLDEIDKRVAEIEQRAQLQERLGQIRNLIDMRLFVQGNKYNQKEHEAAIQEAAQSQWTDEQISRYYGGLLKIKEFDDAQKAQGKAGYNPLGGSYNGVYSTPSAVPEGASAGTNTPEMSLEQFREQKIKGLMNMFGVRV